MGPSLRIGTNKKKKKRKKKGEMRKGQVGRIRGKGKEGKERFGG